MAAAPASDTARLRELAREVLADDRYQTEWPVPASNLDLFPRLPLALSELATLLFWTAIAVVAVLILIWIVQELSGRRGAATSGAPFAHGGPDATGADALGDHEALAREGRYTEAVHVLLLSAIRHLAARLETPPSPASTSRELSRTLPLDREGRDAFAYLVRQVERSLFGGIELDPDEYGRCRAVHDRLVVEASS